MFTLNVDLGQLIIGGLIAIVGYFVKREVNGIGRRLDKHEEVIFNMNGAMTNAIGQIGVLFRLMNIDRREIDR